MQKIIPKIGFSIEAFCEGDARAFNFIFDCYYQPVCFFANRLIPARPVAEDITQEAFMRLWEKHHDFSCEKAIKAFLYIITRNACLNFLRKGRRHKMAEQDWLEVLNVVEESVLGRLLQSEIRSELLHAIDSLPPECRKVMRLAYMEGLQNKEIAVQLHVSVHTVKNQKARGALLLKKRLTPASCFN